jgi:autotransporter-associated beta strand protein
MKSNAPHDVLDDLIAAALHGELTPAERAEFTSRLQNDPAARAAYQEFQLMHDLLEKTHRSAQPDPDFEQRMVSGVRRKLQDKDRPRETALQSLLVLWKLVNGVLGGDGLWKYGATLSLLVVVALTILLGLGSQVKSVFTTISSQLSYAQSNGDEDYGQSRQLAKASGRADAIDEAAKSTPASAKGPLALRGANTYSGGTSISAGTLIASAGALASAPAPIQAPATTPATAPSEIPDRIAGGLKKEEQDSSKLPGNTGDDATAAKPTGIPIADPDAAKPTTTAPAPAVDSRKLIRNAELDLEVKSFQEATDKIAALTKGAGGYVDTSNSQRGGNGKLQGTVVVKVLPQNLDAFLLKLRDLGSLKNQSIRTDDVTKDYFDTQARLENSRRMETQLQELLKRDNGKVSELLQVERELGRVRGDIEQMQGELKLYDFQVQYATVTMQISEKDLNQAAAYLLKEQDDFSLFATDVEGTFQQARHTAEDFKAQVLTANLNHNSGSDVSAELVVMVAPDQIEAFLSQVKSMGRVANFTRQTQRVARDGGDSDQPADQTLTEKDRVQVHLAIRSDDETRKQVALTVVTSAVDTALDQAKAAALASPGTAILSSSLNKTPQGQSTAQLSVRVPGKSYRALLDSLRALGRTASFSLQRDDDSGPGANGDDAPVIIALSLTDDETPLQETAMSVLASDVDNQAQQLKQDAATAGVEIKASSFQRQPDGTELAQMTFRLPMSKYPAFIETLKKLGKVESLTVNRQDRPDQARTDETAPAEITLSLHNQADIVTDNNGLWATLRNTFGDGVMALFGSVRVIGVIIAFIIPWLVALVVIAWIGRRIYLWSKK